ncbi:MAG: shikimate dehydrogenase family protein [Acidaminococcaceae bacterium]
MVRFGLLGEKLGHSLSPKIHKLLFQELMIDGDYALLEVERAKLPSFLAEAVEKFDGLNVTIPYKKAVIPYLNNITREAASIGAVNTISFQDGAAKGYNTDYYGFGFLLNYNQIQVKNKKIAVLGSGGAARAVIQYLNDNDAEEIWVVSRNPGESSEELREMNLEVPLHFCDYSALAGCSGDVLINSTPVGMFPKVDASPVLREVITGFETAVDLIYNPAETVFLRYAQEEGKKIANGLLMLVAQAVAAEEIWLQRKIEDQMIVKIADIISGEAL